MTDVLIISFSDLARDPRIARQIEFLRHDFRVTAAGHGSPGVGGIREIDLPEQGRDPLPARLRRLVWLKCGAFERFYWRRRFIQSARSALGDERPDVIVANETVSLPLALELAQHTGKPTRVIADLHEYEPRNYDDRWSFRFVYGKYLSHMCATYLPRADVVMTVNRGLADEYSRCFGVPCGVMPNLPFKADLTPSPVDAERIELTYHGYVHRSRRIENMIRVMDHLDRRFHLHLILVTADPAYLAELTALAEVRPRVRLYPPVPMREIAMRTNEYDIGLHMLSPKSFNCRLALPNKLFEYIQARLAVAIWPSPEMARVVQDRGCGVVSDDFTIASMAERLNALTADEIVAFKRRAHAAADDLHAEAMREGFLGTVRGGPAPEIM